MNEFEQKYTGLHTLHLETTTWNKKHTAPGVNQREKVQNINI